MDLIRFKVVKLSRILLFIAAAVLIAVLAVIGARYFMAQDAPAGSGPSAGASLVRGTLMNEAKAMSAFASGGGSAPSGIEVEVLSESPLPAATPSPIPTRRPSVLIYHTHTHEAYEQTNDDPYDAVEAWRTLDNGHSVVRVGQALSDELEKLGFEVVHDVTDHEGDALSTAYTRSLETLKSYDRSFNLYIDLHRDAWLQGMPLRFEAEDGTAYAQPMLLIGNGNGFDEKPYYQENLAFAKALTRQIDRIQPGLCKDVLVKDGRYNQHIGVFAVLIEVGHNKNTLAEALNTAPILARAIRQLFDAPGPSLTPLLNKYIY